MKGLRNSVVIVFFTVILSTVYLTNTAIAEDDTCSVETLHDLAHEFEMQNAYLQFHTDNDGVASTNSGPGDLGAPGEVRGNIGPADEAEDHDFEATINAAQEILDGQNELLWDGVLAHGHATFTVHDHHIAYHIHFEHAIHNVFGVHIHNGDPSENNHIHLVDLIPNDLDNKQMITELTGMITVDDLCPTGHSHGGDDHGTDEHQESLPETTNVVLAGHVMQHEDYFSLVDYGDKLVSGNLFLRLPCNSHGLPLVMPVAGHIDVAAEHTHLEQAPINLVEHMSHPGKTCLYQSDLPAGDHHDESGGGHHEDSGASKITSIGLLNTCDRNIVFRTANSMSFTLHDIEGNISDDPYHNLEGAVIPEDGHITVNLHDDDHVDGNVCDMSDASSGGHGGDDHVHP